MASPNEADDIQAAIEAAKTVCELDAVRESLRSASTLDSLVQKLLTAFSDQKEMLLVEQKKNQVEQAKTQVEQAKTQGTFFEDARNLYDLKPERVPSEKSPTSIFRDKTPKFYQDIVQAADLKNGDKLQDIFSKAQGSNSDFPKGDKDIFFRPIDPARAHIFLDSPSCAPGWAHMAEGATGMINEPEGDVKNHIRLLRMMGGKQGKQKETRCLRKDIHNFIALNNEHRIYYDSNPQFFLVPVLPLEKIIGWDEKTPYDVIVFVSSPHKTAGSNVSCMELYKNLLQNFPWDKYFDTQDGQFGECTDDELDKGFKMLRHFTNALVSSLYTQIPQALLEFECNNNNKTRGKRANNGGGKPPPSPTASGRSSPASESQGGEPRKTKKEELDEVVQKLKDEKLRLPFFRHNTTRRPVLKLHFGGVYVPDPWLLMVKAAVNFFWTAMGLKLLPACPPPLDDNQEDWEEAVWAHEQRVREHDIVPQTLTIPATPGTSIGGEPIATVTTVTPPAKASESAIVTPPGNEEDGEQMWENISDVST